MEQQLTQIGKLLDAQDFATIDEANAFLQEIVVGGGLAPPEPETPIEEAQQMVYKALAVKGRRRVTVAKKALAISLDCADAYVLLGEASRTPQEAKVHYAAGVEAGTHALGPEIFAKDVG